MKKFKENISIIVLIGSLMASVIFAFLFFVINLDNANYRNINADLKESNYELKQEISSLKDENLKCKVSQK